MRHNRSSMITFVALAALTVPHALFAQRGRGVGGGVVGGVGGAVGGAVRTDVPAAPPITRGSNGPVGRPVGTEHGMSAATMTRLETNTALSQRIQPLLPPGSDVHSAATGFQSDGEFISALHASHNLGIPFDQLKSQMTQGDGKSLGKAIRTLRPEMDKKAVKDSVKTAERMSNDSMRAAKEKRATKDTRATGTVGTEIGSNAKLSERLTPLLPAGMSLDQASAGFRNTGQFVAALHVAKNLDIPFSDLRARMIVGGESLGDAIHALRPEMPAAEVETGVKTATQASDRDLKVESDASAAASVRK